MRATRARDAFSQVGQGGLLELVDSKGQRSERRIPWVVRAAFALRQSAEQEKLNALALIVEGLLAERRVFAVDTVEVSAQRLPEKSPAVAQKAPVVSLKAVAVVPPVTQAQKTHAEETPAIPLTQPTQPAHATPTKALEKEKGIPAATPAPENPAEQVAEGVHELAAVSREEAALLETAPLWAELVAGGRFRAPNTVGVQVGLAVGWKSALVRAELQPSTGWTLEGRAFSLGALSIGAGWSPWLIEGSSWRLRAEVSLAGEQLTIQRRDLASAVPRLYWDLQVAGAITVDRLTWNELMVGVRLETFVSPTGRTIAIPDGPSVRMSPVGIRLALSIRFGDGA
ncbi:MAG: hypothetical protein K1X64_17965 [Myxococcaceae bacterium]|nr:hypothetical protein [Myxococcaceae bacterium]